MRDFSYGSAGNALEGDCQAVHPDHRQVAGRWIGLAPDRLRGARLAWTHRQAYRGYSVSHGTEDFDMLLRWGVSGGEQKLFGPQDRPELGQQGQSAAEMLALLVSFPSEKIGVGARWSVTQPVSLSGLRGRREVIYTATAMTKDSTALHAEISDQFGEQKLGWIDLQEGTLTVLEGAATGTGSVFLDLKRNRFSNREELQFEFQTSVSAGPPRESVCKRTEERTISLQFPSVF